MSIEIKEVRTVAELRKFIKFPERLYKDCYQWIPPLRQDEMMTLDRKKNPAFIHSEAIYFLAYRNGEIVGRIAGIINRNANADWKENTVRFGWIDFIDDKEVSRKLLDAVAEWGKSKGMTKLKGPLGFSDMDKEGLLIEGFENQGSCTTIYNYRYYPDHLESYGLEKDVDWIQYYFDVPEERSEKLEAMSRIVKERYGLRQYMPKSKAELKKRGKELFHILNEAYSPLYEFTKLNDKQIDQYVNQYLPFVNLDFICVIENNEGKMVGFAIIMPSLSEGMRKAKGKLFPFGFMHIMKSLKDCTLLEMYLIGVLPEYQNKGLNAIIFDYIHRSCHKNGTKRMLAYPQLEHNTSVQAMFSQYDTKMYQKRRSYTKELL